MSTWCPHRVHNCTHSATGVHMNLFTRKSKHKERGRISIVENPYIHCFWSSGDEKVGREDARLLFKKDNIVCRSCDGCK